MFRPRHICALAMLVWSLGIPQPAAAYQIEPYRAIHEAMTALAEDCVDQYGGVEPYDCSGYYAEHLAYYSNLDYRSPVYLRSMAARWPDDPERMLYGAGAIRFGLVFLSCADRIRHRSGIDQIGLLCSVHRGQLRFVHGMRSSHDESFADTLAATLDWASFAYEAASGEVPYDSNFCSYFGDRGGPASEALLANFQSCGEDGIGDRSWTVASLFVRHCAGLLSSCREAQGDEARREMRAAALGALLHLVQDSYSQGHVRRTETAEPFESRITCFPAAQFLDVTLQYRHSDGDHLPTLDENCADPATRLVDDPITASARLLWMLDQRRPVDTVILYLRERVLGQ